MTVPYLCILVALVLVYLPRFLFVTPAMVQLGYDNAEPREQQKKLHGMARRALAAHQNGFETFAPFAAAVIMAQLADVDPSRITCWSVVFVASRVVFVAAYVLGFHPVRSLAFTAGMGAVGVLMVSAL